MSAGSPSYRRTSSSNARGSFVTRRWSRGKILIHRNFAVTLCTEGSILCAPSETRFGKYLPVSFVQHSLTLGLSISYPVGLAYPESSPTAFDSTKCTDQFSSYRQKRVEIGEQYPPYIIHRPVSLWRYGGICKRGRTRKASRFSCKACIEARTSKYQITKLNDRLEIDCCIEEITGRKRFELICSRRDRWSIVRNVI